MVGRQHSEDGFVNKIKTIINIMYVSWLDTTVSVGEGKFGTSMHDCHRSTTCICLLVIT